MILKIHSYKNFEFRTYQIIYILAQCQFFSNVPSLVLQHLLQTWYGAKSCFRYFLRFHRLTPLFPINSKVGWLPSTQRRLQYTLKRENLVHTFSAKASAYTLGQINFSAHTFFRKKWRFLFDQRNAWIEFFVRSST